jgi:error-prone DNA polymerase
VSFVHLHVHSNFSFGDGACRIDELVATAKRMGMTALAITDHDGLYGAVRFYQACQAAGIKPIIGVEISVEALGEALPVAASGPVVTEPTATPADRQTGVQAGAQTDAPADDQCHPFVMRHLHHAATMPPAAAYGSGGYHLVLLARDYEGWSNLCRIISAAHLEHPGEAPVARFATVAKHSDHLIALSACRRGEIAARLLDGDTRGARRVAATLQRVFGRDFFIELEDELLPDSALLLRRLDLLAHELRIETVASNDVHYVTQADAPLHDILAAEAANQPLPNPLGRKNAELYLKSSAQMWHLFRRRPQACRNTAHIAARCNLDLGLGKLHFPAYPLPPGETAYSRLCALCFAGASERYKPLTPQVTERLQRELEVIHDLGFAEYFLSVRDIVEFARENSILYSGRGSAGNSIVSYVLRICDADPIAHELLFERFLNPARREMPDVDIDFCSARRDEVIEYIYRRFGSDNVAMVATVNTIQAPSAVRIVAKAFAYRPDEVNRLSKHVPWGSAARLSELLAERPELHDHEFQHPHYARLVHLAERLADYPAHLGTHLGGFILSRDPLTDRVPVQWAAKGVIVAQFDKDDIETLGLVKMDLLALKMHSAIAETVHRIAARTGEQIAPWDLPRDDPAVYRLISEARTVGVFQLESSGQRNLATRLRERDFEDIIAAISLFRPGPLQAEMIGPFIRRRHGREPASVPHPALWPALKRTYGVILYQEQVIEVAAAIAGFSLAEGDLLRRAMTHQRSLAEMDEIGRDFIAKAVARGVEPAAAAEVFRQLRGFAAYGFNKAHAACFAVVCNASAWLKAHYPAEFFCAILNNQPMGFYSPRVVLNDARRWGLAVLPIDVNRSELGFNVERDGRALRVGLQYVKEMSALAAQTIVATRTGQAPTGVASESTAGAGAGSSAAGAGAGSSAAGTSQPYTSLADFVTRTHISIEICTNLVRVGAFDALGTRREELLAHLPLLYAGKSSYRRAGWPSDQPTPEQFSLLTAEALTPLNFLPSWTADQIVSAELDVLGLNVSTHPLALVRDSLIALKTVPFGRLHLVPNGQHILLAGVLERAQMPWIRTGHRTLFLTLEDETGLAEVVVFNDVYLKYGGVLSEAIYLLIEGELQNSDERGLAVVATRIANLLPLLGRPKLPPAGEPQRAGAWLPNVEPRTRPGRTG